MQLTLDVGVSTNLFINLPSKLLEESVGEPGDETLRDTDDTDYHDQEGLQRIVQVHGNLWRCLSRLGVKEALFP